MKRFLRSLEWLFRHAVVYPLFRILFRNPPHEGALDVRSIKSLLILRYDRIGDIVVTTPIFRKLKRENPSLILGVLASPANAELIRFNPFVDRIHRLHSNWWRLFGEIRVARGQKYDVVLNFIFNRTTSAGILANLIAPDAVKVGQGAIKYRFYFNKLLRLDRGGSPMAEILAAFVNQTFGIYFEGNDLDSEIHVEEEARKTVADFLVRTGLGRRQEGMGPFGVFNLSATDPESRISSFQAKEIAGYISGHLQMPLVIISAPYEADWRYEVARSAAKGRCFIFPENGEANLREIAALIEAARFVVTPDTSIIHIASAMKTPVLGLFTPLKTFAEWTPYRVKNIVVRADQGEPVSSIPLGIIRNSLSTFVKSL